MKVLGIDPALSCLGWGIIEQKNSKIYYIDSGLIKTKPETELHLRLAEIAGAIEQIISLYKPNIIAMEETFVNLNAASSLKLAYVRGALMSIIGKTGLPFYEYAPNKIKKTIVGTGHAQKEQVMHMVKMIISGDTSTIKSDESDALAVAYTGLVNQR
jgi:crossover junction endodeoxyribonuclease RuvC